MEKNAVFYYHLGSLRRYKENLLSDIVLCLWQMDYSLGEYIFKYVFQQNQGIELYQINREFSSEEGRNDFIFTTNNGIYILESKINDKNLNNAKYYLSLVNNDPNRLKYIIPQSLNIVKEKLYKDLNVRCVYWEDLIKGMFDFSIENGIDIKSQLVFISGILNFFNSSLGFKEKESLEDAVKIFEPLLRIFEDVGIKSRRKDDWEFGNYLSIEFKDVWFCLKYCPVKGSFLCFCHKKNFRSLNFDYRMFKNIRCLGDYFHDTNLYYELIYDNNSEIKDIIVNFLKGCSLL